MTAIENANYRCQEKVEKLTEQLEQSQLSKGFLISAIEAIKENCNKKLEKATNILKENKQIGVLLQVFNHIDEQGPATQLDFMEDAFTEVNLVVSQIAAVISNKLQLELTDSITASKKVERALRKAQETLVEKQGEIEELEQHGKTLKEEHRQEVQELKQSFKAKMGQYKVQSDQMSQVLEQ